MYYSLWLCLLFEFACCVYAGFDLVLVFFIVSLFLLVWFTAVSCVFGFEFLTVALFVR